MKAAVYYSLIIIMFLIVPACLYEYSQYAQMETEQMKTNAMLSDNANRPYAITQDDANSVMNNDLSVMQAEKKGFAGAAAAFFLIPALMLVFKGKLLRR